MGRRAEIPPLTGLYILVLSGYAVCGDVSRAPSVAVATIGVCGCLGETKAGALLEAELSMRSRSDGLTIRFARYILGLGGRARRRHKLIYNECGFHVKRTSAHIPHFVADRRINFQYWNTFRVKLPLGTSHDC